MVIASFVQINFDLLSVGIAVASILFLGSLIYFNNRSSLTNQTFFFFALLTAVWGVSNYLEYRFTTIDATLWALRAHLFISTWHAFLFLQLAYVFPKEKILFPRWYKFLFMPLIIFTAFLTLTPAVFTGITALAPVGEVTRGNPGPGILLFMLVAFGCLFSGLWVLLCKIWKSRKIARLQTIPLFVGMSLTACLILVFNVVLPNVFSDRTFIPLAALFVLPFVALTSYAIYRHHLFSLRLAATAFLGFMVTAFTFVNIIYSASLSAIAINVTAFIIVLLGSIRIVRDALALEELAEELRATNLRQEGLIRFISHEVKNFLTKDLFAFTALMDGDFGSVPDDTRAFVERARGESAGSLVSVMDILKASNQKKGTVEYKKETFDLKAEVAAQVEKLSARAKEKGLALTFSADPAEGAYNVTGDKAELGDHVFGNLIENAINYTPAGSVTVTLAKRDGRYVLSITDTGVGITDEDRARLFTEGGHGRESQKINVHSTGYGLYIAKNIVSAHGGAIRAESKGKGKGSVFTIELPAT